MILKKELLTSLHDLPITRYFIKMFHHSALHRAWRSYPAQRWLTSHRNSVSTLPTLARTENVVRDFYSNNAICLLYVLKNALFHLAKNTPHGSDQERNSRALSCCHGNQWHNSLDCVICLYNAANFQEFYHVYCNFTVTLFVSSIEKNTIITGWFFRYNSGMLHRRVCLAYEGKNYFTYCSLDGV